MILADCDAFFMVTYIDIFKANSHIRRRAHAGPMPFPCHAVPH
jgi:hypothetical protein